MSNACRTFWAAACLGAVMLPLLLPSFAQSPLTGERWKRNGLATPRFEINGTGGRNNPLRHELAEPQSGEELFVRYRIRYDGSTIDTPRDGNGEFFVLWLDRSEGGDGATHSNVPNVGLHVAGDENRFMARFSSSGETFGPALEGDRDFSVVARLWKSDSGADQPYDQLDLWVDPADDAEFNPDASTSGGSLREVRWIGFSTGRKTEFSDRIFVWDMDVASSWEAIHGLPPKAESPAAPGPGSGTESTVDFTDDVHPLLEARCFGCHQGDAPESEVRLDQFDDVLNQTTPWKAEESRLFQLVASGEMPPEGEPLDDEALAVLKAWIDEGVDWDEQRLPTAVPQTDHWAFQPLRRPELPPVEDDAWVRSPVDAFIAAEHQRRGVRPAPEADSETLRRRMHLDLLGVPPELETNTGSPDGETADGEDGWDESLTDADAEIDALLANPAYGERWGRHWLDVARWAESNGHQHNRMRPDAWRYRDYVVDAFNDDKPYDVFVREQIAGDELEPGSDEQLIATGFLAAARYSGNELDKAIQRNDILVDTVNTTAAAFLGLTFECAQCHSHKFDPISIRDYYRFQAFFGQGQPGSVVLSGQDEEAKELIDERWRIFDTVHARLVQVKRKQGHPEPIYVIPKSVVRGMHPGERQRFKTLEAKIAELPQTWGFYSPVTASRTRPVAPHNMRWPLPHDPQVLENIRTHLLLRGDVTAPGPEVDPGWPAVFGPTPANLERPRTALADWITSPDHPLTARVWVNRIWQWHFGRGLVETSGDLGAQGASPTHPQLLDYLAAELIDSGWSTKRIHRLIMSSATYRQSSQFSQANQKIDPENRSLWRWTPRRLEAEAVRDAILAVSGQLDPTRGGRSLATESDSARRSLYLAQRRDHLPAQQMLFDSANGISSCSRRRVSTSPLQPLWLMNSEFMQSAAQAMADRLESPGEIIPIAMGRAPAPQELQRLETLAEKHGLESACLAVLNSSEFLYLP